MSVYLCNDLNGFDYFAYSQLYIYKIISIPSNYHCFWMFRITTFCCSNYHCFCCSNYHCFLLLIFLFLVLSLILPSFLCIHVPIDELYTMQYTWCCLYAY